MFDWIPTVCGELRREMIGLYWAVLPTLVLLTIIFEFFKDEMDVKGIIKRAFLSAILLLGFEYIADTILFLGNGIVEKINLGGGVAEALEKFNNNFQKQTPGLFRVREMLIYVINWGSFLFALLSFYMTEALVHFVYAILLVMSPLLTLCMIPKETAHITKNLFKGLITLMVWKVLWAVLGSMLVEFLNSPVHDWSNFFISTLVNLCVGVSMFLIPAFTRSLLGDGLESAATGAMKAVSGPVIKKVFQMSRRMGRGLLPKGPSEVEKLESQAFGQGLQESGGPNSGHYVRGRKRRAMEAKKKLGELQKKKPPKNKELRRIYDQEIESLQKASRF